jgi:hypothetical protein
MGVPPEVLKSSTVVWDGKPIRGRVHGFADAQQELTY